LACLLLGAVASGCGSPQHPATAGPESLRRGNGGDPGSLDPALAEDLHAYNVLGDLYEGLVVANADGGLAPGVALQWTQSPDGRRWQFTLRPEALWSNGERVTAAHFVAGLRHAVDPATGSPNAFLLEPIANAAAILRGDRPPETLGVHADGDGVLVIGLERPARWLPTVLSMPIALPRLPGVHDDPAAFRNPSRFVGNGPYRLESWRLGGEIRLLRNPRFRAAAEVAIPEVRWLSLADPVAELNLYRAGELDVTATVPPAQFAALARERPCELQSAPGLGLYYLAFDVTEPPLDDAKLREALSLAIDRDRLVSMLDRGEAAAYGLLPPALDSGEGAGYGWRAMPAAERLRLAREALADSRYAGAPPAIQLTYDAGDVHEQVALAVRAMWQEALGVEARLRQLEWKAFLDQRADRKAWQAMRFVWVGDYDDASTFTGLFTSGGENNLPGYANPRYDALVAAASALADGARRDALLQDAEGMLLGDYPIAPLYFMTSKHLVAPRVAGFSPNALDRHPSRWMRLETVSPRSGNSGAARCGSGGAAS
jgi:oligopeptide transport system substrate-binding protein